MSGFGMECDHCERIGESVVAECACRNFEMLVCYADRLVRGFAFVVNVFDFDVIVFGGGFFNIDVFYWLVFECMQWYVFSDCWLGWLLCNCYGDLSGVRGVAWLFEIDGVMLYDC